VDPGILSVLREEIFNQLRSEKKQFIDTIKLIATRVPGEFFGEIPTWRRWVMSIPRNGKASRSA
jgi:hypothetical protein